jgi:outer membrane receptor protein involved in Fe transport
VSDNGSNFVTSNNPVLNLPPVPCPPAFVIKERSRLFYWKLACHVFLIAACCCVNAAGTEAQKYTLDIPAADAGTGLNRFARQTNIPLLYRQEDLQDIRTNSVQGEYSIDEALEILLKDSGIRGAINQSGVLAITAVATGPGRQHDTVAGNLLTRLADFLLGGSETPSSGQAAGQEAGLQQDRGSMLEEITVTGSRIIRDGMSTPTPVTVVGKDTLLNMAPTTVIDALVQLPQFVNSDTPLTQNYISSGHAGASRINLRGVGAQRTLTLLNGRRIVPATRTGEVNIALLPEALIKRVDIVTGGASAAYGSDAVSGVVNFILDTDYAGVSGYAEGGITGHGDNQSRKAGLIWGSSIGDSLHFVVSGEYYQADGIEGYYDREWFNSWAAIRNPDPSGPREVIVPQVHSRTYTYGGLISGGPFQGIQFDEAGEPVPFVDGSYAGSITQSGGSGIDPGEDVYILPDQQRINTFANINYELSRDTSFFVQGLYGRSETGFETVPSLFAPPWGATIYRDNAYLHESLRLQMDNLGIDSFPFGRMAGDADLGAGFVTNTNEMLSVATGFETRIRALQLNAYYQYGRNTARLRYDNTARIDRLYRALDAVNDPDNGSIVCRSTLTFADDGCVPVNMFGSGTPSAAAIDWITEGYAEHKQIVEQHISELTAQRDINTGWAGPLSLVAGAAVRKLSFENQPRTHPAELLHQIVEPAGLLGYRGLPEAYEYSESVFERTGVRPTAAISGAYGVWEVFGETIIPLYASDSTARKMDLNLAVRYADYQGSGGVLAWKAGAGWWISEGLRLRWTRSRDVRAGTLAERFDQSARGGGIINDPVAEPEAANYAITQVQSGNPYVDPERADTDTFGLVYQPSWLDGLSFSADYYEISIEGAVALPGAQYIVDQCYTGNIAFCSLVHRNSATGLISTVDNIYQNIDGALTRGVDIEVAYQAPVSIFGGAESLSLRGLASYINEASITKSGGASIDRAGQTGLEGGAPHWQLNLGVTYGKGPFALYIQQRYIGSGSYNATWGAADINDNAVDAAYYTNLQLAWDLALPSGSLTLFGHISNLFDADPPLAPDWRFHGSIHTNENLFDVLGRRITAGLRFSF